jgi:hypothetical protein
MGGGLRLLADASQAEFRIFYRVWNRTSWIIFLKPEMYIHMYVLCTLEDIYFKSQFNFEFFVFLGLWKGERGKAR